MYVFIYGRAGSSLLCRLCSGCREQGLLWLQGAGPTLVVVRGLLVVVASLVAEHVGSVVGAPDSRAHAQ